jgi:glycosyltransferase involved in cell wall biosynthesis
MSIEPATLPDRLVTPPTAADALGLGRPIRVCFMIDRLARAGTESQLIALIRHLDHTRIRPHLCLLDGEDAESRALEPEDCSVLRLGVRKLLQPRAISQAGRLARYLRRERIDILQVYFPDSTYLGVLAGCLAGVPHIVRTRNNINHWMTPAHRRLGRLLNRFVTMTVANSEPGRQAVLACERPDPASVVVLENGVDLDRFAAIPTYRPATAESTGPRRVGMVANLRSVKGVDVFVEAAALIATRRPDVEFLVAGEGPQRPELERLIVERGLAGRFLLLGSVADIPEFLGRLDVAVLSSRSEGMPNAVLESMAAGRPIVATEVGGIRSLIEPEAHGLLVPPEDPAALAGAIDRLLADPDMARRFATAARERTARHHSRAVMIRRFEDLYGRLFRGPIDAR